MVSKSKPDDLTMGYLITLIAKYYFDKDLSSEELGKITKEKLLDFNLYNYQEYKYHNKIMNICNGLYSGELDAAFKEREYIPIYKNELKLIESLNSDRQKKIMFTFYAVARYMDCDGWINKKNSRGITEVFKLANVTLTSKKRNELLHELYVNGYISFGKKIDNLNIKVKLDDTGDIIYKIKEFKNIGNQYIGNFKKGYKQCICCGKKIKIKSPKDFSSKYCCKCSYEIKLHQVNDCKKRKKL